MVMALASLRGLEYRVPTLSERQQVRATTSLDWATFTFTSGQPARELLEPPRASPTDVALASAANALAFRPVLLDRSRDEAGYRARGIVNFPPSKHLWYTDGGILDSEPLTRTLDLVREVDQDSADDTRRIQLLVHPNPTGAPTGTAWADEQNPPTWLATLLRARDLQRTQSVYDDLLHLEQINTRLDWTGRLFDEIGPVLDDLDGDTSARLREALVRATGVIEGQRRALAAHEQDPAAAAPNPSPTSRRRSSCATSSPRSPASRARSESRSKSCRRSCCPKRRRSPSRRCSPASSSSTSAGSSRTRLRESDFDLGYRSTLEWLRGGGLSENGFPDELEQQALARAEEAHRPGQQWRAYGRTAFQDLPARERLALVSVFAHIGARRRPRPPPPPPAVAAARSAAGTIRYACESVDADSSARGRGEARVPPAPRAGATVRGTPPGSPRGREPRQPTPARRSSA